MLVDEMEILARRLEDWDADSAHFIRRAAGTLAAALDANTRLRAALEEIADYELCHDTKTVVQGIAERALANEHEER